MKTPFPLPEVSIIEALSVGVGLRLIIDPSMPSALGLLALAGAWALEKIFVSHARVYRNSSIEAHAAAEKAVEAASSVLVAVAALEGRLTRLETKEGWRTDGQGRR
jgi:energy-converting hydrogenase Eha subunit B